MCVCVCVCVSRDPKEHQCTFCSASYSRSHSHTTICYIAISNIQQPYILVSLCVTWHKWTSVYISYCQLQQVTQPHCNMLHSYQQHTAAIYITVCVMWHKWTSVYISYCQLQQVTQPHCSNWLAAMKLTQFIWNVCSFCSCSYMKIRPVAADIQKRI